MSMISCMIGCGIVAIPHTVKLAGSIWSFIIINVAVGVILIGTTWMLL